MFTNHRNVISSLRQYKRTHQLWTEMLISTYYTHSSPIEPMLAIWPTPVLYGKSDFLTIHFPIPQYSPPPTFPNSKRYGLFGDEYRRRRRISWKIFEFPSKSPIVASQSVTVEWFLVGYKSTAKAAGKIWCIDFIFTTINNTILKDYQYIKYTKDQILI